MHDVHQYDGGAVVNMTPSLHHYIFFSLAQDIYRDLISVFYDRFRGSQNGDESSRKGIELPALKVAAKHHKIKFIN
jgi:hypothetical protein